MIKSKFDRGLETLLTENLLLPDVEVSVQFFNSARLIYVRSPAFKTMKEHLRQRAVWKCLMENLDDSAIEAIDLVDTGTGKIPKMHPKQGSFRWFRCDDAEVEPEEGTTVLVALKDPACDFWQYDVARVRRGRWEGHWMDLQGTWEPVAWTYFIEPTAQWRENKEENDG